MGHSYDGSERRKHSRVPKKYNLSFYIKDYYKKKSDSTFIKDISRGGVRFTTSHFIEKGTHLVFEISVSQIAPKKLILEGLVISSKEIIPRMVYEIRANFNSMDKETMLLFDMIEK